MCPLTIAGRWWVLTSHTYPNWSLLADAINLPLGEKTASSGLLSMGSLPSKAPCQFERTVTRSCLGNVTGNLSLIDLENAPVPVWEKELNGRHSMSSAFANDRITGNGNNNHPASLRAPPTEDKCPAAVVQEAVLSAGSGGIAILQEKAWI